MNQKNIVVAGAGATGWLAALTLQKKLPDYNISIIKSSEIGTIGVGESLTSEFTQSLIDLDIDLLDFLKESKATVKVGIKYKNWKNNGEDYHHVFVTKDYFSINNNFDENIVKKEIPLNVFLSILNNENLDDSSIGTIILNNGSVPFTSVVDHGINFKNLTSLTRYAFNVDAKCLSSFLEKVGISRNIKLYNGTIDNIIVDDNDKITNIVLDNQNNIPTDFVFDCTGLSRKIIGEYFKTKWVDLSSNLRCTRAIAFFREIDKDNIDPYVTATAMDYGWMWNTPLQHRIGCGYVFDPTYINSNQAKEEVENLLGHEIKIQREISFNPGYYEKTWVSNCISLGMAAAFVEPLEALTIFQGSVCLKSAIADIEKMMECNPKYVDLYNEAVSNHIDKNAGFIYLHYMTDKTNTEFWKNFTKDNVMPNHIKKQIDYVNNEILTYDLTSSYALGPYNYYSIMYPKDLLNIEVIKNFCSMANLNSFKNSILEKNKQDKEVAKSLMSHSDFLKKLGLLND
jgi:tryptophan halogenase